MKKISIFVLLLLFCASASWAVTSSIIGGYRSGLSFGIVTDNPIPNKIIPLFGIEGKNDYDNPLLLFIGRDFRLGKLGFSPISLRMAFVGYFGNNTLVGVGGSLVFNDLHQTYPLYLEIGLDLVGKEINPNIQFGWKLI